MKSQAPAHMWGLVLAVPSLLAVLHTTIAEKDGIDIYSLTVDSRVSSRFAHTVVTSRVVNRADTVQEATFQLELPKTAFITNFSMSIDGEPYPGIVKEKAAAQDQYNAAVGRGESAGLVKTAGRHTEEFQVSVNVAPHAKVNFELVYQELLKRRLGMYELRLKVKPQQLVKHLQMDIYIFEPQGISTLETESSFMTPELAKALTTSQNKTKAHIRFKPTLAQQRKSQNEQDTLLDGDFFVRYDVDRSESGGSIQIANGYFVHQFAPEDLPTIPKNVIFVIDTSGSMRGRKIQQTREALVKILNDLSPEDQFNLIEFSWHPSQWRSSMVQATKENLRNATNYASTIQAGGGTDINGAMLLAVKLLDTSNQYELLPSKSASLIILLTDGEPTVGETNPKNILKNVAEAVDNKYSVFCLGFGFDVNYPFLEKMALDNGGLARRIYEDSDSALQLQDFFNEVANPLLLRVAFEYPNDIVDEVTKSSFQHHFKGSEMVVAGKLQDKSADILSAKVSGQMHHQNITFKTEAKIFPKDEEFQSPNYIYHNFIENLWALLTIQQYLEQMVSASGDRLKALEVQALNLSLKYNFVTPLTHMVVTKPEGQEQFQVAGKPVEAAPHSRFNFPPGGAKQFGLTGSMFRMNPRFRGTGATLTQQAAAAPLPPPPGVPGVPGPPGHPGHPGHPGEAQLASVVDFSQQPTFRTKLHLISSLLTPTSTSSVLVGSGQAKLPSMEKEKKAHSQVPTIVLPLPGTSVDQLCVDLTPSENTRKLFIDPEQGLQVTGQFNNGAFAWIEVTIMKPHLKVYATPERLVMTRGQKNSEYKWRNTLYSLLSSLRITMDKMGQLLISGPDRVTIGLFSMEGPQRGVMLFLSETQNFSRSVRGDLGHFYWNPIWDPEAGPDATTRTLRVQGREYTATKESKLKYEEGSQGTEISCWTVKI